MKDFVAEVAGQTLLRLVSRGNAIIAELLRLSSHIPPVFKVEHPEHRKYANVLFDFKYLQSQDLYEGRIEDSAELIELDSEFRENHLEILKRFYLLFESIYKYIKDFRHYLSDLDAGVFIQLTLEIILLNDDGKQLLAEALYLYGVMLTLLDSRIEGPVRERMLISYLRYRGQTDLPLIDDVCALCRSTGYSPNAPKKPANYPEEYFARFPIPNQVVSMIIGRLRSDDIYKQIAQFPLPEHRSTALATQAMMLYIILFFAPDLLHNQPAIMREIVDKHFPDNWVIAYYLGFTVDLSIQWEGYRAAKLALNNTTVLTNINHLQQKYWLKVGALNKEIEAFLVEGVLVEEYILDNISKLLACLRDANATMRWLLLHTNASTKKLRDIVNVGSQYELLKFLMNLSQFEFVLKNIFQVLLNAKQQKWEECRTQGSERMKELGEYFSGEKALTRVKKNEHLQNWFNDISKQINSLDFSDSTQAGRKIQQLIQALEEVEQFHQIESSLQVKQFLIDTRQFLSQMIRIVNVKEEIMITVSVVSDMSYAWDIIVNYVEYIQEGIKQDPRTVIKLRSLVLKLSSILDLPLVRINQAGSADLISVSEYYSSELVAYVRKVLEIVPRSMFLVLKQIIDMQTNSLIEIPTKVEKERVRDFAQMDQRYELARMTHAISVFTEGILAMETTLVGIIQVDPKQLLEDGIRKELVLQIAEAMEKKLVFRSGKIDEMELRLRELATVLDGFRRSFQYIQDYVNIQGLRIWQEEFSRIVNFYVEQECNTFLKKKTLEWQSSYQDEAIPIPVYPPIDNESVNMIGRFARELLQQSNYRRTTYLDQMSAWFDPPSGREVVGIKTFAQLLRSLGAFGISGLDRLLCFMTVKDLQSFTAQTRAAVERKDMKQFLAEFEGELHPTSIIPMNTQKVYSAGTNKTKALIPLFLETVTKLGQIQLIRRQISNLLNFSSKLDSNSLYCALENFNKAVVSDIQMHYINPDAVPYPSEDNPLLSELAKYLETTGLHDPYTKIYITAHPLPAFPCIMFLFVISQMQKYAYNPALGAILPKKQKDTHDWIPLVVGVITLLRQFHSLHTQQFLAYLGQYVRGNINVALQNQKEGKTEDYPDEVISVLLFLEDFCRLGHIERKTVEGYFPAYIFDHFKHHG